MQTNERPSFVGAARLRELFWSSGLTQEEFAKKCGINRATFAGYLNGYGSPSYGSLIQICKVFNVSADWLLGLSEVKTPDATLQVISAYTGLNEAALRRLNEQKKEQVDLLNELFPLTDFWPMLDTITECLALADDEEQRKKESVYGVDALNIYQAIASNLLTKCIDRLIDNKTGETAAKKKGGVQK